MGFAVAGACGAGAAGAVGFCVARLRAGGARQHKGTENKANHHAHHLRHLHGRLSYGPFCPGRPRLITTSYQTSARARGRARLRSRPPAAPRAASYGGDTEAEPLLSGGRLHLTKLPGMDVAPGPAIRGDSMHRRLLCARPVRGPFGLRMRRRQRANHPDRSDTDRDYRAAIHRNADRQRRCDATILRPSVPAR